MIRKCCIIGMILSVSLFASNILQAATIVSTSCSQQHVQAAIDRAVTGDTVNVPPGNCTWTIAINIPDTKRIKLQGAGKYATVIAVDISSGWAISANYSGARITGFGFNMINGADAINIRGTNWRVDNCKFNNPSTIESRVGIFANGGSLNDILYGLVDHCEFFNSKVLVMGNLALLAHKIWARGLELGSEKATYVEDNTFTFTKSGNCMDANVGGAYVFRYNTVIDSSLEAHSVQGNHRATRKWEIYGNIFSQVNRGMWVPMFLRGGTGVVFNNTLTGAWGAPGIALDNVRSCETRDTSGMCNGSSPWDGNQVGGYPCRDQIGRSTDAYLWTVGSPYPPQALEPAYAWNNKHGANDVIFFQAGCAASALHIQPGRDYYNNMIKPDYHPYTYPHPLTTEWHSALRAPSNFRMLAN